MTFRHTLTKNVGLNYNEALIWGLNDNEISSQPRSQGNVLGPHVPISNN